MSLTDLLLQLCRVNGRLVQTLMIHCIRGTKKIPRAQRELGRIGSRDQCQWPSLTIAMPPRSAMRRQECGDDGLMWHNCGPPIPNANSFRGLLTEVRLNTIYARLERHGRKTRLKQTGIDNVGEQGAQKGWWTRTDESAGERPSSNEVGVSGQAALFKAFQEVIQLVQRGQGFGASLLSILQRPGCGHAMPCCILHDPCLVG